LRFRSIRTRRGSSSSAAERRLIARLAGSARLRQAQPETFNFLGFTFIRGKSRRGKFLIHRKSRRDRVRAKLKEVKDKLRMRMHRPLPETGKWLGQVVRGFLNYHAVPTNIRAVDGFRSHILDLWRRTLQRRSQQDRTKWDQRSGLARDFLPTPRVLHLGPATVSPSSAQGGSRMRGARGKLE
jgi:hypothetical protein